MANKRITELPNAGTLTGSEVIAAVQNGTTVKALLSAVIAGATRGKRLLGEHW